MPEKKPDTATKAKWEAKDREAWFNKQVIQRSYQNDVVSRLEKLKSNFEVHQYGALTIAPEKYPLYLVTTPSWHTDKPTIFITGGVHGYETSGVHGALEFLEKEALNYTLHFNLIVAPCVSPWGYETINRWNPQAIDPNRSFFQNSPAEESAALMQAFASIKKQHNFELLSHIDLHETTDTDNTVFLPTLAERDGEPLIIWEIPDGFYLVGNSEDPVDEFQRAIILSVEKVTHIAPPDAQGNIIGEPITQNGVINYPIKKLGLCTGFSDSHFSSITEVYPDSPKVTDQECTRAQVAALKGGLEYLINQHSK